MRRNCALTLLLCLSLLGFTSVAQAADLGLLGNSNPNSNQNQLPPAADFTSLSWFIDVDCFAIGSLSGSAFYMPTPLSGFSHPSWAMDTAGPVYTDASGDLFPVAFDLAFDAPLLAGTEILVAGYVGGTVVSNVYGLLTSIDDTNGEQLWFFENVDSDWDPKGEVPEPASLLLLGIGVAGAAARRMRRR